MDILTVNEPTPALRFILQEAMDRQVSDVHIEPLVDDAHIRFRVAGDLTVRYRISRELMKGLIVRIKVLANMDVGESRKPQDGSFSCTRNGKDFDFRVSVLPTIYGESAVIRILSGTVDFIEENRLGMTEEQTYLFRRVLARKSGLVLVVGPTGSGKTSTLYTALRLVSTPQVKVISLEDPVEYHLTGVMQVEINEKSGLTFARGLRSLVRQDPDIIMIGEIRDKETANLAVEAALTGHLVLSSLHTDSVSATPVRLRDMGIPSYLSSAALSLILAQRLVRDISHSPKTQIKITEKMCHDLFLPTKFIGKTGYIPASENDIKRRTALFEMADIDEFAKTVIYQGETEKEIRRMLQKRGHKTMAELAVSAMEEGKITIEEAAVLYENG